MQQEQDYLFKILLVGDTTVGKSSLLLRLANDCFNEDFLPTIGVDFKIKTFDLNGKTVKLQIWDSAGQDRFKTIMKSYYEVADGVILVYDVTNKQSFIAISNWLAEAEKYAKENTVRVLVGNKIDLKSSREVAFEEGKGLADSLNMTYIETSAKSSFNVEQAFITLAQQQLKMVK